MKFAAAFLCLGFLALCHAYPADNVAPDSNVLAVSEVDVEGSDIGTPLIRIARSPKKGGNNNHHYNKPHSHYDHHHYDQHHYDGHKNHKKGHY